MIVVTGGAGFIGSNLVAGLEAGERYQTLLGITGSGKSFTIAGVIEAVQKPTILLAPNKTLAAQIASELRNRVARLEIEGEASAGFDGGHPLVGRPDERTARPGAIGESCSAATASGPGGNRGWIEAGTAGCLPGPPTPPC